MNNNIIKLNTIINLLINDKNLPKSYYWKMGTDIFNMLDRLYENIKNLEINNYIFFKEEKSGTTIQGKNRIYNLFLNDINITPIINNKQGAALTTATQYKRVICAFGIGVIQELNYKNEKDFIINRGKIWFSYDAKWLLKINNRYSLIIKIISNSLFSRVQYVRDLAYSIIMSFLIENQFDFKLLNKDNQYIRLFKTRNDTHKLLNLTVEIQEILKDISIQGINGTYKSIIECIKKNTNNNIDNFIEDIWSEYNRKKSEDDIDEDRKIEINKKCLISKIKQNRSKFKSNIFKNRKELGLINSENDNYSDIEDLQGSKDGLLAKWNEAEAAHIFEVSKIKDFLLNNDDIEKQNEYLEFISNPNNGIIMKHDYHKSFDRGQWTFDSNGNMVIPYENKKYLFEVLKLKFIKINTNVLNEDMKKFLNKR